MEGNMLVSSVCQTCFSQPLQTHSAPKLRGVSGRAAAGRFRYRSTQKDHGVSALIVCLDSGRTDSAESNKRRSLAASTEKLPSPDRLYKALHTDAVNSLISRDCEIKPCDAEEMNSLVNEIRAMLRSVRDGETSPSAYDTAWVSRVPATDGSGGPLFPRALQWLIDNQLHDGSWGDERKCLAHDRLLNTLACVNTLQTWNAGHSCIQKGVDFLSTHMEKTQDEVTAHMLCGFEIVFTAEIDEAKRLGLPLPYGFPLMKMVREARDEKLRRIPLEILHTHATTLLYSLEGLRSLVDWQKIISLQSEDGSFLSSPAATACVLMHTGDPKCLEFLKSTLATLDHNAVPCQYPIDLFERLWVVDTLQRLGIDRFFRKEIKEMLRYVYSYWAPSGIGWARENPVQDIDDTAMAFRLLRLEGYEVSADVFEHFKKDGKFFCFPGESHHGVSEMFNLYRASQVRFPHEMVLEEANEYTRNYLNNAIGSGETLDKWSIKKDLAGEVAHALSYPLHRTLPRIEHRTYIEQYGEDDAWLAKTIYRLPLVSNQKLLRLAKLDFNRCQGVYRNEIRELTRWWKHTGLDNVPFIRKRAIEVFFAIAGYIFEPGFANLRLAFAKMSALISVWDDYMDTSGLLEEHHSLYEAIQRWDPCVVHSLSEETKTVFHAVYGTINDLSRQATQIHGYDVSKYLRRSWDMIPKSMMQEGEWAIANQIPTYKEYIETGLISSGLPTVLLISVFFSGETISHDTLMQLFQGDFYRKGSIACRLINDIQTYEVEQKFGEVASSISSYMRDNPAMLEEEAIRQIYLMNERMLLEWNWEMMECNDAIPPIVKRIMMSFVNSFHLFYRQGDQFTFSNREVKQHVEKTLFQLIN